MYGQPLSTLRQAAHDQMRDAILRKHGFTVLRFWTSAVRGNPSGVMEEIIAALEAAPVAHGRATRQAQSVGPTSPP